MKLRVRSERPGSECTSCGQFQADESGNCALTPVSLLDRIATHMLAFDGDSEVVWFEGNFKEYEADLYKRNGIDADQPKRIKYTALVRG